METEKSRFITNPKNFVKELSDYVSYNGEKWRISSDKGSSGSIASIGSINNIDDLVSGNGVFVNLGEDIFDEYWANFNVLQIPNPHKERSFKKLTSLEEFLDFKGMDITLINKKKPKCKSRS